MAPRDDVHQLLSQVALRNGAALESLYRLVGARLLAVAVRVVQDKALAEDVVQEVFLSVWNQSKAGLSTSQGEPGYSLPWLCVITRNRAIDHVRKKKPEQALHWEDDEGNAQFHDAPDDTGSPLDQLLAQEDGLQLGHCMGTLESEPRQALVLAFFEGLTHVEIAQRMRRPLGTVKAWTRRSLLRLKTCMELAL